MPESAERIVESTSVRPGSWLERRPGVRLGVRLGVWLGLAALVVVVDQVSKFAVSASLRYMEVREVTGFFNLVLVYNTGAAFSLLADAPGWQRGFFISAGVVASVVIVVMLVRHIADRRFCLALSLILGGAIGNVWDRIMLGHVVDFVQLHAGGYYWPSFNVADSAICCGAALLIWDSLFEARASRREQGKAGQSDGLKK